MYKIYLRRSWVTCLKPRENLILLIVQKGSRYGA
jgi:hypothetical protein